MRRREFITLVGCATAWPLAARAQQVGKVHRIAVAHPSNSIADLRETGPIIFYRALFNELRRLGYVENRNLIVERYTAEGRTERQAEIARDVVCAPQSVVAPPGEQAEARRRVGRPRGEVSIAERHARLAFAAACQAHRADVVQFWYETMMDRSADMGHRITCSVHLMNRAYGLPLQITNETVDETRRQVLEVRWLPPSPDDHSRLILPEPD